MFFTILLKLLIIIYCVAQYIAVKNWSDKWNFANWYSNKMLLQTDIQIKCWQTPHNFDILRHPSLISRAYDWLTGCSLRLRGRYDLRAACHDSEHPPSRKAVNADSDINSRPKGEELDFAYLIGVHKFAPSRFHQFISILKRTIF